jgi:glycine/D-amino acid oxidase-like deaminating enzyme
VLRTSDVLVIGGGIVGAATAYHLARRGASVTLVESERLAFGATGRNLGYIWLHTRRVGPELDLARATRDGLAELPAELDADFGLRMDGGLIYAKTEAQAEVLRAFVEQRVADGLPLRFLDGDEARALAPILPASVVAASFCPLDAQVDSRRYVQAYGFAAQRLGVRLLEGVTARAFETEGDRIVRVHTDAGPITAGTVVLAAGAWSPALGAQLGLRLPIHPMRLQIAQTEPMAPILGPVLYGPAAVKQYRIFQDLPAFRAEPFATAIEERLGMILLESACQQADGSFLLGIAMDYPGFDLRPDLAGVALVTEGMLEALPALRSARFARAWAGLLPFTSDNLPLIGRLPEYPDLIVAAGHVFGNVAGPTTGRLVADLVCGGDPVVDPTPYRPDRPGLSLDYDQSTW